MQNSLNSLIFYVIFFCSSAMNGSQAIKSAPTILGFYENLDELAVHEIKVAKLEKEINKAEGLVRQTEKKLDRTERIFEEIERRILWNRSHPYKQLSCYHKASTPKRLIRFKNELPPREEQLIRLKNQLIELEKQKPRR